MQVPTHWCGRPLIKDDPVPSSESSCLVCAEGTHPLPRAARPVTLGEETVALHRHQQVPLAVRGRCEAERFRKLDYIVPTFVNSSVQWWRITTCLCLWVGLIQRCWSTQFAVVLCAF